MAANWKLNLNEAHANRLKKDFGPIVHPFQGLLDHQHEILVGDHAGTSLCRALYLGGQDMLYRFAYEPNAKNQEKLLESIEDLQHYLQRLWQLVDECDLEAVLPYEDFDAE